MRGQRNTYRYTTMWEAGKRKKKVKSNSFIKKKGYEQKDLGYDAVRYF